MTRINRTVTDLSNGEILRIDQLRESDAYVLLGDPGAGKTSIFQSEANQPGCAYVSARDFITLEIQPEWHGKTLFIDGLDETRAGGLDDGRTALDRIRAKLQELGGTFPRRFRISCREADWLGASDQKSLERVAPGNVVRDFRLNPLNDDQIVALLSDQTLSVTPEEFLESAREHGLEGLLDNPQTLFLLVESVDGTGWPRSRSEVFRLACERLVTDPNVEHQAANRKTAKPKQNILRAAGYLCALQLVADIPGFSVGASSTAGASDLDDLAWNNLPLQDAVHTRAFRAERDVFVPAHRSIAEYLGAAFLAAEVEKGLSIRRVLALLTGSDGGVVSGLRGLHAWLAVHLREHRLRLCEVDPIGVTLYGDAASFTKEQKETLLQGLAKEIKRSEGHALGDWNTPPPTALVTPDMIGTIEGLMDSSSRLAEDQTLITFVLDAVKRGMRLPELGPTLLKVVRDSSRWPSVRKAALDAYIHVTPAETAPLRELALDIQVGTIEDADDELLGRLLKHLFPTEIRANTVTEFLHPRKAQNFFGAYVSFWTQIAERLPDEDAPTLLDTLTHQVWGQDQRHSDPMLSRFVGRVLVKGIELHGDSVATGRLLSWLGIPPHNSSHPRLETDERDTIRRWIETRSETFRQLLLAIVQSIRTSNNYRIEYFRFLKRLCGANPPPSMPDFWLRLADEEPNHELADFLFSLAVRPLLYEGNTEYSIEYFQTWVEAHPRFGQTFDALRWEEIPDWRKQDAAEVKKWALQEETEKQGWISWIKSELKSHRPHAGALHNLASAYFGTFLGADGSSPENRLTSILERDTELVETALEALNESLRRDDLPSVDDILGLAKKGQIHLIGLACLAGMDQLYAANPKQVDLEDREILAKSVAFRYVDGTGNEPEWFKQLVREQPQLVAAVLADYAKHMLQTGQEHIHGLWSMAFDDQYSKVATLATPTLLYAFPVRLKKGQAESLECVLKSALRYCRNDLEKTIAQRLNNRSLDAAQKVYWLACGLILDQKKYEKRLERYIGGNHERREHLGAFLTGREERSVLPKTTPPEALGLLVRLLGPGSAPDLLHRVAWVTPAMRTSDLVSRLIERLSEIPSESAAIELSRLESDPTLSDWDSNLRRASYIQRVSQREALFHHPTPSEVIKTLSGKQPANAADLHAILADNLDELVQETRHENTNRYLSYWNVDSHGRPCQPRPEETCRDTLLEQLRPRLKRLGIEAQPEALYADRKRADIRVSYTASGFTVSVPIEVKRDSHADLWRAITAQLVPQYTRDPDANGHGIYLVFWFGAGKGPHPPKGKKPQTAEELRQQLEASIEPDRRHLISVVVLDCSVPGTNR